MPRPFKLIDKKFSEVDKEWQWTYELRIKFNFQEIIRITITDHLWKKPGREMITKELILELLGKKMNEQILKPFPYHGRREIYRWETTDGGRKYRLFFWFKDGTTNHLWIKNCHPID